MLVGAEAPCVHHFEHGRLDSEPRQCELHTGKIKGNPKGQNVKGTPSKPPRPPKPGRADSKEKAATLMFLARGFARSRPLAVLGLATIHPAVFPAADCKVQRKPMLLSSNKCEPCQNTDHPDKCSAAFDAIRLGYGCPIFDKPALLGQCLAGT